MRQLIIDKINKTNIKYADEMARIELIFAQAPIVEHFYIDKYSLPAVENMTIEQYVNDFLFISLSV